MDSEVLYTTFTSHLQETPVSHMADLENAYESLLASRDTPILSMVDMPELSEDDKGCSRNLNTAHLFKTFNDKAATLNDKIRILNDNSKLLEESVTKFSTASMNFMGLCKVYYDQPIDTYKKLEFDLSKEYLRLQIAMKKKIEQDRLALELDLDGVNTKLNGLRNLIQTGIKDIIKPEDMNKKMCPVCYDREVSMVMVPCGHTYCDGCSNYDYRAKCPQCRATINSRVKIYFSI